MRKQQSINVKKNAGILYKYIIRDWLIFKWLGIIFEDNRLG